MGVGSEASEVACQCAEVVVLNWPVSNSQTQPKKKSLVYCLTCIRFAQSSCKQLTKYLLTATVLNLAIQRRANHNDVHLPACILPSIICRMLEPNVG